LLDQIEAFFNLYDRFKRSRDKASLEENIADRFIRVFEAHGVMRNQIPRFFDHALTLKDVQNANSLLEKLNEQILDDMCSLFAIKRAWLDGASSQVHPINDFYKRPEEFSDFLGHVTERDSDGWLTGELYSAHKNASWNIQCFFVLKEKIGFIDNEPINRYHLCSNFSYTYWKARADLAACMAIAHKNKVHIKGLSVTNHDILNPLANGELLLPGKDGLDKLRVVSSWYPEDMALEPNVFLKDIDPEVNKFGITSALERWVKYAESGLMDIGFQFEEAKEKFKKKLMEI
jgi:hypothetical protein